MSSAPGVPEGFGEADIDYYQPRSFDAGETLVKGGLSAGAMAGLSALGPWAPILFGLAGSLWSGYQADKARQRYQERVKQLLSAGNISKETAALLEGIMGGQGYQSGLAQVAAGANASQAQIANALASRGLGTSGIGAVMSGLTPAMVGQMQMQLATKAQDAARQQALENIKAQIGTLSGEPSGRQVGAQNALNAIGLSLEQWAKGKYPTHPLYRTSPSASATSSGGEIQVGYGYNQPRAGSELTAPR